jgi:hypothetical protein
MNFKIREHQAEERLKIAERIQDAENKILHSARHIFVGSKLLKVDLFERYGIAADVLYAPILPLDRASDTLPSGQYYITESVLSQQSRFIDFLPSFKQLDNPLYVFCPCADHTFYDAARRIIADENLRVSIVDGFASDSAIRNACGYLYFDKGARRVNRSIANAATLGVPVFYAKDCGAVKEILVNGYSCSNEPSKFVSEIHKSNLKNKTIHLPSMRKFAERMVDVFAMRRLLA